MITYTLFIDQLMNIQPDQIKKLKVRYLKCSKGGLHDGEVLNFVCIDANCRNKGLICPVCQNTTHAGYQTMHLKIFLSQISKNIYNQEQSSQLGGLAEYLRSLDNSKKIMLKSLKQMVEQLSSKIKEIQQKIQSGYCSLRKVVLSQSTVSMRLPELFRLITQNDIVLDEQQIQRQINRYSELLEFKNGKIITVDSAQNIVTEYANKSGLLAAHLTTVIQQTAKIFASLPLEVSKYNTNKQKEEPVVSYTVYSTKQKSYFWWQNRQGIVLLNDKKIELSSESIGGIVFTTSSDSQVKKASFKIVKTEGGAITLGVANPLPLKDRNYQANYQGEAGLHGMCSYGFLPEQLQGQAFMFGQGDTIDITFEHLQGKLVFSRRHGIQKCQTFLPLDIKQDELKNMQFFVMLTGAGDIVQLVE